MKYDKYVKREPLDTMDRHEIMKDIKRFVVDGPSWGSDFLMTFSAVPAPLFMLDEPHIHEYDEFVCFLGGDPMNLKEFGAEIEFCLGEEQEKHLITSAAVIFAPAGFPHCPLNFKVVRKPVILMTITLGKEYVQGKVAKT